MSKINDKKLRDFWVVVDASGHPGAAWDRPDVHPAFHTVHVREVVPGSDDKLEKAKELLERARWFFVNSDDKNIGAFDAEVWEFLKDET